MTSFKKMKLISEEELERIKQKQIKDYNPNLRTMAFLQSEMDDIISSNDYDSGTKEKLFRAAMNRYIAIKSSSSEHKTQIAIPTLADNTNLVQPNPNLVELQPKIDELAAMPVAQQEVTPTAADPEIKETKADTEAKSDKDILLGDIPAKHRRKAAKLLNFLEDKKEQVYFDKDFVLSLNGIKQPDSNFRALFKNLYVKSRDPTGKSDFINALKVLNAPHSFPESHALNKFDLVKTRSRKSIPPGKRVKVLQVYRM